MEFRRVPNFKRDYRKLPAAIRDRVDKTLRLLGVNPRHPSLRAHKREGEDDIWQARVTQNYRLYFQMEGDTITLLAVGPHEK